MQHVYLSLVTGAREDLGQDRNSVGAATSAKSGEKTSTLETEIDVLLQAFPDIERVGRCKVLIRKGFVSGMRVPAVFYASDALLRCVLGMFREWYACACGVACV